MVCVEASNPFGHLSPEVLEALAKKHGEDAVYRTDENGTVEFITDRERL